MLPSGSLWRFPRSASVAACRSSESAVSRLPWASLLRRVAFRCLVCRFPWALRLRSLIPRAARPSSSRCPRWQGSSHLASTPLSPDTRGATTPMTCQPYSLRLPPPFCPAHRTLRPSHRWTMMTWSLRVVGSAFPAARCRPLTAVPWPSPTSMASRRPTLKKAVRRPTAEPRTAGKATTVSPAKMTHRSSIPCLGRRAWCPVWTPKWRTRTRDRWYHWEKNWVAAPASPPR